MRFNNVTSRRNNSIVRHDNVTARCNNVTARFDNPCERLNNFTKSIDIFQKAYHPEKRVFNEPKMLAKSILD